MIVDVNVSLSRWPFRRLPCDTLPALVRKLRQHDVVEAWVGSLDGLLHRDVGGVNARLAEACRREKAVRLVPFGTVQPMLPDWREDLRRCHEEFRMPGIRLHPNYHGYRLGDPVFAELLTLAARRGLIVQIALRMEDVRTQHPLMKVADVDASPLAEVIAGRPDLRVVLINWSRSLRGAPLVRLAAAGNVHFDVTMHEGIGAIGKLLKIVPTQRLLFGSHLPLFNLESSVLKLRESPLTSAQVEAISHQNARRLLGG